MGKVRNATMFANQPRRTTTTYTYSNKTSVAEKPAAGRRFGTNLSNQFTKYNDVLEKKAEAKPAAKPAAARPYTYNAPVAANKYTRPATAAQPKAAAPKPFQAATQRTVDDLTSQVSSINIGNVNVSAAAPQRASSAVDSSRDRAEPQMVCSYINEILSCHRRVEPKYQPDQYIESGKQTQVSKKVRCTLVDWVVGTPQVQAEARDTFPCCQHPRQVLVCPWFVQGQAAAGSFYMHLHRFQVGRHVATSVQGSCLRRKQSFLQGRHRQDGGDNPQCHQVRHWRANLLPLLQALRKGSRSQHTDEPPRIIPGRAVHARLRSPSFHPIDDCRVMHKCCPEDAAMWFVGQHAAKRDWFE